MARNSASDTEGNASGALVRTHSHHTTFPEVNTARPRLTDSHAERSRRTRSPRARHKAAAPVATESLSHPSSRTLSSWPERYKGETR
jgi:hypothetical protein